MNPTNYIVYTPDLEDSRILDCFSCTKIPIMDVRSAVYTATGIAAQKKEPVMVVVNASNSSRSAFSGMTEAFYRNLPVVLMTVGDGVDYSKELNDVIVNHFVIDTISEYDGLPNVSYPIHIEIKSETHKEERTYNSIFDILQKTLDDSCYLYAGQNFALQKETFNCKVIQGGTNNCCDGAIANILGASLIKKHKRYIGVINEEEFLHDMNSLGNINVNDSLLLIVCVKKRPELIASYSISLSFECCEFDISNISEKDMLNIINSSKKTIVLLTGV